MKVSTSSGSNSSSSSNTTIRPYASSFCVLGLMGEMRSDEKPGEPHYADDDDDDDDDGPRCKRPNGGG